MQNESTRLPPKGRPGDPDGAAVSMRRREFTAGFLGATALSLAPGPLAAQDVAQMWVRTEGEGRDLVFLHGWTMDHRDEARTYEPIFSGRGGWRRHYLDLPGMGRSPPHAGIRDLDGMLEAVLAYIDGQVGGTFAIAGTSAGAYLARGVVARLGPRVSGVLLRAPLVEPDDSRRDVDPVEPLVLDPALLAALDPADRTRLGALLVQTPAYARAKRLKLLEAVEPATAVADQAFLSPIRGSPQRYRLSFDPDVQIGRHDRPALIVTGRQDESVGYRDAWRLLNVFTRATFVALDRGEHGLPIDQQQAYDALVHDWLDRMEEDLSVRGGV